MLVGGGILNLQSGFAFGYGGTSPQSAIRNWVGWGIRNLQSGFAFGYAGTSP